MGFWICDALLESVTNGGKVDFLFNEDGKIGQFHVEFDYSKPEVRERLIEYCWKWATIKEELDNEIHSMYYIATATALGAMT